MHLYIPSTTIWRERQLWEVARSCFAGPCIHQVEQGIFAIAKASVQIVMKALECVEVHGSNAHSFPELTLMKQKGFLYVHIPQGAQRDECLIHLGIQ